MKMSISVTSTQAAVDTMAASGSKSKGQAGQTTGGQFFATLAQCMTQEESSTNTDTSEVSSLFASLAGLTNASGDAEDPLLKLLDSLLSDLDQAEQMLQSNPDLMAMLQQWLQQAQMITNPDQANTSPEMSVVMQMMTSQPESLTILVRDQLEQIRQLLQSTPAQQVSSSTTVQEGVKLLESLQTLLQRHTKQEGITGLQQQQVNAAETVADPSKRVQNVSQSSVQGSNNQMLNAEQAKNTNIQSFQDVMKTAAASSEQTAMVQDDSSQEVMTAGQFALRSEGMQSSKSSHVMRASHFAEDMSNYMIKQMFITTRNGISQAKITLYPENLGQVDVRLTMQNGQLVAHFITEHAAAREMLDSQLSLLRGALQTQGIQVDKLEVSQQTNVSGAQNLSSSMFQREQQSNNGQGQSSSNQTRERNEIDGEIETLEDIRNEIIREQLTGSTFQASV